ncbi:MAG: DUF3667 domain-containing protein [Bacteroidia bacterium]|jgi:hypothetical protein|nr:DUF3667 domain-containing protein [Bacteroidia bacterium]
MNTETSEPVCLNCHTAVSGVAFCPTCGQKTSLHRFTLSHIGHEVFHTLTHTDKGALYLIRELTLRPGVVISEYISGKRKKYFNPFTFFFLILSFVLVVNSYVHPFTTLPENMTNTPGESVRMKNTKIRAAKFQYFIEKRSNVVSMVAVPFFAFCFWLFTGRRKYYAEHLVACVFLFSFMNLIALCVFYPLMGLSKGTGWHGIIVLLNMLFHVVYLGWAYAVFRDKKGGAAIFTSSLMALAAVACWSVCTSTIGILYIIFGS